jgi:hypothetical protein
MREESLSWPRPVVDESATNDTDFSWGAKFQIPAIAPDDQRTKKEIFREQFANTRITP